MYPLKLAGGLTLHFFVFNNLLGSFRMAAGSIQRNSMGKRWRWEQADVSA
jgi:hypothetical protein